MTQICSKWINAKYFHITITLIISGILYFLGNTDLAITDPVESNYALTAKEMLLYLKMPLGLLLLAFIGGSWYIYMYTMHGSDFINVLLQVDTYSILFPIMQ